MNGGRSLVLGLSLRQHLLSCYAFVSGKGNQHHLPHRRGLEQVPTGLASSFQVLQLKATNADHCLTHFKESLFRMYRPRRTYLAAIVAAWPC